MRIAKLIFVGSMTVLAGLAAPALAKNSNVQKTDDNSAPSCQAYQQAADGSWTQRPCQEMGSPAAAQAQHKSATRNADEPSRTR